MNCRQSGTKPVRRLLSTYQDLAFCKEYDLIQRFPYSVRTEFTDFKFSTENNVVVYPQRAQRFLRMKNLISSDGENGCHVQKFRPKFFVDFLCPRTHSSYLGMTCLALASCLHPVALTPVSPLRSQISSMTILELFKSLCT